MTSSLHIHLLSSTNPVGGLIFLGRSLTTDIHTSNPREDMKTSILQIQIENFEPSNIGEGIDTKQTTVSLSQNLPKLDKARLTGNLGSDTNC